MALYSAPLRPRPPKPLVERLLGREPEIEMLRSFRNCALMEQHRTEPPWCGYNQVSYLEAPSQDDGIRPLHAAVALHKRKMVAAILEGGACPDLTDNRGRTPLMIASQEGFTEMLELLLQLGASHSVSDSVGRQALHYAVHSRENSKEILVRLLAAKADANARDLCGVTPLMLGSSIQSTVVVETLLSHDAGALQVDFAGQRARDHGRLTPRVGASVPGRSCERALAAPMIAGGRSYRRWDDKGQPGSIEQLLYREERRLWELGTPGLSIADKAQLNCGLPRLAELKVTDHQLSVVDNRK